MILRGNVVGISLVIYQGIHRVVDCSCFKMVDGKKTRNPKLIAQLKLT